MIETEFSQKIISTPKESAEKVIAEYGDLIRWPEEDATIVDIGCGTGSTTITVLQDLVGKNVNNYKIIGIDSSDKMISTAKETFREEEYVDFKEMGIGGEYIRYPSFRDRFHIAFSMMHLHMIPSNNWIKNIYTILKANGQAFLIVPSMGPLFELVTSAFKNEKWTKYQRKTKHFISGFLTRTDTAVWLTPLLEEAGFRNMDYKYAPYDMHITHKDVMRTIIMEFPFIYENIPSDLINEFMDELIEEIMKKYSTDDSSTEFYFPSTNILIIADK